MTAWESDPAQRVAPARTRSLAGPDPVGQVALGGGADAAVGPGGADQADVVALERCVAWTRVVSGPSAPAPDSTVVGVRPWTSRQASFSAGCSET